MEDRLGLRYARIAGFLYLIIIVFGMFSEVAVRSRLIIKDDASVTVANIAASEGLYRIGFAADAMMLLSDVAIAILFYLLFRPVSKTLSLMAAAFRLTQAAILGFNLLNYYAVMLLLDAKAYETVFQSDQRNALVMFFLDMHAHGYDLGLLFFALSTLILGYLVSRSGYVPKWLGYTLMAAGAVYFIGSFTAFLAPDYVMFFEPMYIVPFLAELSFCLWLLIKGIRL